MSGRTLLPACSAYIHMKQQVLTALQGVDKEVRRWVAHLNPLDHTCLPDIIIVVAGIAL